MKLTIDINSEGEVQRGISLLNAIGRMMQVADKVAAPDVKQEVAREAEQVLQEHFPQAQVTEVVEEDRSKVVPIQQASYTSVDQVRDRLKAIQQEHANGEDIKAALRSVANAGKFSELNGSLELALKVLQQVEGNLDAG